MNNKTKFLYDGKTASLFRLLRTYDSFIHYNVPLYPGAQENNMRTTNKFVNAMKRISKTGRAAQSRFLNREWFSSSIIACHPFRSNRISQNSRTRSKGFFTGGHRPFGVALCRCSAKEVMENKEMAVKNLNMQKRNLIHKKSARYARRVAALLIVTALISTGLLSRVQAAAGDLDLGFGSGGKVLTSFGAGSSFNWAFDVAVQADGKIVASGAAANDNLAIARYNPDGTLDSTFGVDGQVTTSLAPSSGRVAALAIQSDGKIVAGGVTATTGIPMASHFMIARYNPDGSLDTTFGSGGITITAFSNNDDLLDLAIQSDGRIIAVGWTTKTSNQSNNVAVLRYNANGTLDNSFGVLGLAEIDAFARMDIANGVVIQTNGRILVGGVTQTSSNFESLDFLLLRLNTNGSLDTSFGMGGKVTTDFSGKGDAAEGIALQPDGRIVLGGHSNNGLFFSFALARYNGNGSPDTTFGSGGKTFAYFYPITPCYATDIALLPNGKIVTSGYNYSSANLDFMLARFDSTGHLDGGFGSGGKAFTDFSGGTDQSPAIAVYGNDQIVAAGLSYLGSDSYFALARYLGDGLPTSADLSVTMSASLQSSLAGKSLTYSITVTNLGPDTAHYITLRDVIPASTTFSKISAAGWATSKPVTGGTGEVVCSKSTLAPGESVTVKLVVKVDSSVPPLITITDTANVATGYTADPDTGNNSATTQTTVP